ncbi:hypothetical protein [Candidatus Laterigemmans baculatus]|uniref:hypothetical protein n=1 Tax=Candidatus Laterigemmans baculatus TaxID=2770505 RepID=UPI0013DBBF42|nr:hypothetical protein [Candidatus Laterigemmans baculatus]
MTAGNHPAAGSIRAAASKAAGDVAPTVLKRGGSALQLLLEARCFARELDRSFWDFALEAEALRRGGLVCNDLRWLVCKGFLEHATEVASDFGEERRFQKGCALTFTETSCFVLTDDGVAFVQQFHEPNGGASGSPPAPVSFARTTLAPPPHPPAASNGNGLRLTDLADAPSETSGMRTAPPCWDRDRQELRMGTLVVKQFKVPAPNQEMVIAVFQEEGWPPRIDDPLPPRTDLDPKRRLHDTINSLNRNQKTPLIRFLGDGSGQGVRWEPTIPQSAAD